LGARHKASSPLAIERAVATIRSVPRTSQNEARGTDAAFEAKRASTAMPIDLLPRQMIAGIYGVIGLICFPLVSWSSRFRQRSPGLVVVGVVLG